MAYKCDRCKTLYEEEIMDSSTKLEDIYVSQLRVGNSQTHSQNRDLCPNCARSFVNWYLNGQNAS